MFERIFSIQFMLSPEFLIGALAGFVAWLALIFLIRLLGVMVALWDEWGDE